MRILFPREHRIKKFVDYLKLFQIFLFSTSEIVDSSVSMRSTEWFLCVPQSFFYAFHRVFSVRSTEWFPCVPHSGFIYVNSRVSVQIKKLQLRKYRLRVKILLFKYFHLYFWGLYLKDLENNVYNAGPHFFHTQSEFEMWNKIMNTILYFMSYNKCTKIHLYRYWLFHIR